MWTSYFIHNRYGGMFAVVWELIPDVEECAREKVCYGSQHH